MFGSSLAREPKMEEGSGFIMVSREVSTHREDGDEYVSEISNRVDSLASSLWPLNTFLHENPELAFKEYKAHDALTEYMQQQDGWQVIPSAYGIETAWMAVYDSGKHGPAVSFNVEMDALPDIGHACGHNLIATASLAAGLATAHMVKQHNLPGKILLIGTPGEEGTGGGKIQLLKAGAYDQVDISLISHPGIMNNSPMVRTTAFVRLEAEYYGRAAHGANSPWLGINALDALIVAYNAVSVLRQQTMLSDVIGISITDGGGPATNVIHAYAAGACTIRAATSSRLAELQGKVTACFRAGAEATGAKLAVKVIPGYADHVPNRVLAESYARYWTALPHIPSIPLPPPGQLTWVKASTDQGNLSHVMPSVNASFAIPAGPLKGQPHSRDFEVASGSREAFEAVLRVGKALAGTAIDVLSREGLLERVNDQWRRDMHEMG